MRTWLRSLALAAWLPRSMSAWAWLAWLAAAATVVVTAAEAASDAQAARPCSMPRRYAMSGRAMTRT